MVNPSQSSLTRSERTRAMLLAATRSLIEEEGFERLTMAAVAKRAGVSRRAVYLHFASRADLIAQFFDYVSETEKLAASTRPVWASPDAVTALAEWARHLARFHSRVIAATRAFERVYRTDPDAAPHRARYVREQLGACRRLAEWLERERQLAPEWTVETATDMLWGLISTDMIERLLVDRRWSRQRLAEHLTVLLQSTFVGDAEERSQARSDR